jgi:uncharacterized protein (DUF433 family)
MRTLSQQLLHDRNSGLSEAQIAEKHNLTTVEVRTLLVTARSERRTTLTEQVRMAAEKNHWSNTEIAQFYGLTENEVRLLLKGE